MSTRFAICRLLLAACISCSSAATAAEYTIVEAPESISLRSGDEVIWTHTHRAAEEKPYFHPLRSTQGAAFTSLRPADHVWHRGLWFCWKYINGVNYWEENPKTLKSEGETRLLDAERAVGEDLTVDLRMRLTYLPRATGGRVLDESRWVRIDPPGGRGVYRITWSSVFTALEDVELNRTPLEGQPGGKSWGGYAGYSLRVGEKPSGGTLANSKRQEGEAAHRQPADWMTYTTGEGGSILLLDHPENFSYPTKWYSVPQMPFFSPCPVHDGPKRLKKGEDLKLRYRVVVSPAVIDEGAADAEWEAWRKRRFGASQGVE